MELLNERIPAYALATVSARLDKLNSRAVKLGITPARMAHTIETTEDENGTIQHWANVSISGEYPALNGWKMVAVLSPLDTGVLIKTIGNAPIPARYRDISREDAAKCDHCKLSRYRLDTFVLQRGNEYLQIGRNCLKDYLPGSLDSVLLWLDVANVIDDSRGDDDGWGYGSGTPPLATETYMQYVALATRVYGFVPSSDYTNEPTRYRVNALMGPNPAEEITPADIETAKRALEWARNLDSASDYSRNLRLVCSEPYYNERSAGILASAVHAYKKSLAVKTEREARKVSEHIGKVGERLTLDATFTGEFEIGGYYGVTYVLSFLDSAGNVLKWFASNPPECERGTRYSVKATVKEHKEWNGIKETHITRAKVLAA